MQSGKAFFALLAARAACCEPANFLMRTCAYEKTALRVRARERSFFV